MRSAMITGLSGPELTSDEAAFLASARPAGLILFARNCQASDQIRRLVGSAREAIGADDVLVTIDQEGGRVQRLRPPLGRALPPAAAYGHMHRRDPTGACRAAFLVAHLLAQDLRALGINTDCAPVLDVPVAGADGIIGDRAFSDDPQSVGALGGAVAKGLMAGGVVPVMKHIPGHGRAGVDSHLALPVVSEPLEVLTGTDFAPFRASRSVPAAMTAHVVFAAIDPDAPASTSPRVISQIVRGVIGFDGLLMSDDLGMKALTGPMRGRAEAVIAAGSDIALHCSGELAEMNAVAEGVPALTGAALRRFRGAAAVAAAGALDRDAAEAALAEVVAGRVDGVESV